MKWGKSLLPLNVLEAKQFVKKGAKMEENLSTLEDKNNDFQNTVKSSAAQ